MQIAAGCIERILMMIYLVATSVKVVPFPRLIVCPKVCKVSCPPAMSVGVRCEN